MSIEIIDIIAFDNYGNSHSLVYRRGQYMGSVKFYLKARGHDGRMLRLRPFEGFKALNLRARWRWVKKLRDRQGVHWTELG